MASMKSEKLERASPARSGTPGAERRETSSRPRTDPRRAGDARRGDLRDLLGDYSEQTGSFFG